MTLTTDEVATITYHAANEVYGSFGVQPPFDTLMEFALLAINAAEVLRLAHESIE